MTERMIPLKTKLDYQIMDKTGTVRKSGGVFYTSADDCIGALEEITRHLRETSEGAITNVCVAISIDHTRVTK